MSELLKFTRFCSKSPLSKEFSWVDNLLLKKANVLFAGTAETIECTFRQFKKYLINADAYTAFGFGISKHKQIEITSKRTQLADDITFITRSKEYYQYHNGPGIIMLDYDPSIYCHYKINPKKFLRILKKIHPALGQCAKIVRESVSAGVHGENLPKKAKGFHVYIPVVDASKSAEFGKLLNDYLWQAGYGYIALSKDGKMFERSPIDVAVFSPERLDFVGIPVVNSPLSYDAPRCRFIDGNYLDLSVLNDKKLDCDLVKDLKRKARKRRRPDQKRVQNEYDHQQCLKYIDQGYSAKEAKAIVANNRANNYQILNDSHTLYFCNGIVCTIKEAVERNLFDEWMADPIEGLEYGTTTAQFVKRHGQPFIHSFAHGGRNYRITSAKDHNIFVIEGNPGTGKTYSLCRKIAKLYKRGHCICIVVPTTQLMKQYKKQLLKGGLNQIDISMVSSAEDDIAVGKQLNDAIQADNRLIMITHAYLKLMKQDQFKKMAHYDVFIDEVFSPLLTCKMYDLKESIIRGSILRNYCIWNPVDNVPDMAVLSPKKSKIRAINQQLKKRDNRDSLTTQEINEVLQAVKDNSKIVIITKMERSMLGNYIISTLFNCNNLRYFRSCTIASAFVKHTELYHWCERYFNMVDVTANYASSFRNLSHRIKMLMLIPFIQDNYSKHYRNVNKFKKKSDPEGTAINAQQYVNLIIKGSDYFDDETLRVLNNDDFIALGEHEVLAATGHKIKGKRISSQVHGLNKFQHINSAVIVAAFNLSSFQTAFINKLLPFYNPWLERNVLTTIQCFMRTSLRDAESTATVHVMVPDQRTCDSIVSLYDDLPMVVQHSFENQYEVSLD